jgi:putative endonuclease
MERVHAHIKHLHVYSNVVVLYILNGINGLALYVVNRKRVRLIIIILKIDSSHIIGGVGQYFIVLIPKVEVQHRFNGRVTPSAKNKAVVIVAVGYGFGVNKVINGIVVAASANTWYASYFGKLLTIGTALNGNTLAYTSGLNNNCKIHAAPVKRWQKLIYNIGLRISVGAYQQQKQKAVVDMRFHVSIFILTLITQVYYMAQHNDFGKAGEQAALKYLLQHGHKLLALNYRYKRAEVDIITTDGPVTVFTEVKARSTNRFGYPEEYVDKKKIKLLKSAAEEYLYQNKIEGDIRFDIISITPEKGKLNIHHIKDAFFYEEDSGTQLDDF